MDMLKTLSATFLVITLSACSKNVSSMADRTAEPCADKPNCVSTQDTRPDHHLASYELVSTDTNINAVEQAALTLHNAKTAEKTQDYLRIECTSSVFRFVDDLEIRINDGRLLVRSESRTGHSDFGVNRERADSLRLKLIDANIIKP
ncbi:conserved exported protein of unknown function [Vibrio tapetis subsp. tapetis]|uniref:Lipoprotein n=2 Tax=Vibrio tapetis TaxID=52443 RepID=A0A2N8ZFB1_9VIBR|nr:conserved exported protein of unknown function [Vibrio tapetis subsp. tapetis]